MNAHFKYRTKNHPYEFHLPLHIGRWHKFHRLLNGRSHFWLCELIWWWTPMLAIAVRRTLGISAPREIWSSGANFLFKMLIAHRSFGKITLHNKTNLPQDHFLGTTLTVSPYRFHTKGLTLVVQCNHKVNATSVWLSTQTKIMSTHTCGHQRTPLHFK